LKKGENIMTIRKLTTSVITAVLTATLAIGGSFSLNLPSSAIVAYAAESNVITGGSGTATTTLSTGESASIKVVDCEMTITVGTKSQVFKVANMSKVVGMAKIAADDLLHVFTLSGKYYCIDLQYGSFTTISAYRNTSTGKYVKENSSGSYEVFASSFIPNSKYFYERISTNSTSRELLIARADFNEIVNPTPTPTPEVVTKYNVTFKDWDGTILKVDVVEKGNNATPPASPTRSGYVFKGWDKEYTNITADTVVTAVYNVAESGSSTSTTDGTADTEVKFDINFWWDQYSKGNITWDQLCQMVAQYNWTQQTVTDEASRTITYYFYDPDGKLQRTESVTTGSSTSNSTGSGTASATGNASGNASVDIQSSGQGGATGTAEAHTEFHATTNTTSSNSGNTVYIMNDKTTTYHENNGKKWIKLTWTREGKTFTATMAKFDRKKGIVTYNGIKYKNVKDAHFTSKSHNLLLLLKNGNYRVVPVTKVANGKVYKARLVKGKWTKIICGHNGLAKKLTDSKKHVRGVQDAQAKFVREDTQDSKGTTN
jgi:hypothetical protein